MRKLGAAVLVVGVLLAGAATSPGVVRSLGSPAPAPDYGQLPLLFEENQGQAGADVRFLARGPGHGLAIGDRGAALALKPRDGGPGAVVGLVPRTTGPAFEVVGLDPLATGVNYFGPAGSRTGVATYGKVAQRSVWPGIDLVWYGRAGHLEYDAVVAAGADPSVVRLGIEGATTLRLEASGNLVADTPAGPLVQQAPLAYQEVGGRRRPVEAGFALLGRSDVGFRLGHYDPALPLVIDPVLVYSSFLSGTRNQDNGLAVDGAGSAYVVGTTLAADFPTTPGAFDTTVAGTDAFITKISPAGTALVYSTYLGGPGDDRGIDIAVDGTGAAYVTGLAAPGFPTTAGAYDTSHNGGTVDVFVAKLSPSGSSLTYSTLVGGSFDDSVGGVAIDGAGSAYITGTGTSQFPMTNTIQMAQFPSSLYVVKLSPDGSGLTFSARIGDSKSSPTPSDIAVDTSGAAYVSGTTGWPVCSICTPGAFQTVTPGTPDAFVLKLQPSGTALAYGTLVGGQSFESGAGIAVDAAGAAYLVGTGGTISGFPYPATQPYRMFVAKVNPTGSGLGYVAYIEPELGVGRGIAVDATGTVWAAGRTAAGILFEVSPTGTVQYTYPVSSTGVLTGLSVAMDPAGAVYAAGITQTGDFPVTPGAYDTTFSGTEDVFVMKVATNAAPPAPPPPNHLDAPTSTMEGAGGQWAPWFSTTVAPSGAHAHSGDRSLRVAIGQPYGWGVALANYPGFPAAPGTKAISFWARADGGPLGATLTVEWRGAGGQLLQTDAVPIATLTTDWQQGAAFVNAPAGTVSAYATISNARSVAGDVLFLDDIVIAPLVNALDAPTSSVEGSVGAWAPWFSTAVSSSTDRSHSGTRSLKVARNQPYGWGVTQANWPGFATSPGPKTITFAIAEPLGAGLAATMTVTWYDAAQTSLGTSTLTTTAVGTGWEQVATNVTAPAGTATAYVSVTGSGGGAGDSLYFDDVAVVDGTWSLPPLPPRAINALDPDTAGLEGSLGEWAAWFNASLSRGTTGHTGDNSLDVTVTGPYGWGVTLRNYPGFTATPGAKTISFWALGTGAVTMQVHWRGADGNLLRTDALTISGLSPTWQQASVDVVAPAETALVSIDFYDANGSPGDVIRIDDVTVADS